MPPQSHIKAVQRGTDSLVSCMPGEDFLSGKAMKVYALGGSAEELGWLREICEQNGWQMKVMRGFGRPRGKYPVQKVVNTYSRLKGIRATARELGLSSGVTYRVLRDAGVLLPREGLTKRSKNG